MNSTVLLLALAVPVPDGVSVADCDRFPQDWEMSDAIVDLLRNQRERQLDMAASTGGPHRSRHEAEAAWIGHVVACWNAASWAIYCRQRGEWRDCLSWLRVLRAQMGCEDYAAGRLPGPVPVPRERISRRMPFSADFRP